MIDRDEAFTELYHNMYPQLLQYAKSAGLVPAQSEEAVQETFRIAWIQINSCLSSYNPRGWLVKTLRNVINNMRRHQAIVNRTVVSLMTIEESEQYLPSEETVESSSLLRDVYESLLGQDDFFLLERIALQNASMLELAQELGVSLEACKKRVQRARYRAQKILKKQFDEHVPK